MKKNLLRALIAVAMLVAAGLACAPQADEPTPLFASGTVDPCRGVDHCTKVTVSERADGSKSALISGTSAVEYKVIFDKGYDVMTNTTIDLTDADYLVAPSVDGCVNVTWTIDGTSATTVVDGIYVFSCP